MANHLINDRGETVIAQGAPGSRARVRCECPALLERLRRHYRENRDTYGAGVDRAIAMIRKAGIDGEMSTLSLLEEAGYENEGPGTVMQLIRNVTRGD